MPKDIYRRHDNCKCSVEYAPGKGGKRQTVHSGSEGKRRYVKGKYGDYGLTKEARVAHAKEMAATEAERAKDAREKRIETWQKKKLSAAQNAHSKQWTTEEERAILEKRRAIGAAPSTMSSKNGDIARKVRNSDLPNGLPISGEPNAIVDKTDDFGKVLQRRIYGEDGKAFADYDTTNHGQPDKHPTGAHRHMFDYSKKRPRQFPSSLTSAELDDNADIIQEGVNYHDQK